MSTHDGDECGKISLKSLDLALTNAQTTDASWAVMAVSLVSAVVYAIRGAGYDIRDAIRDQGVKPL
jgi:hypothetical protein